jgi:hypothetical protein
LDDLTDVTAFGLAGVARDVCAHVCISGFDPAEHAAFHARRLHNITGLSWDDCGITSIKLGGDVVLRPRMTFPTPIILVESGSLCLGCSETWLVTETGCEAISGLSRGLAAV